MGAVVIHWFGYMTICRLEHVRWRIHVCKVIEKNDKIRYDFILFDDVCTVNL
jgi:hypothetical protein